MKNKQIKIYSDHIQKRVEQLENEIDSNCLRVYNEYKSGLEEAYMEGIIEYELALANYHLHLDAVNSEACAELERLYEKHKPVKVIDLFDVYVNETIV